MVLPQLCSRVYSIELEFLFTKTTNSLFETSVAQLVGKRVVDFLFAIIDLFR